MVHKGSYHLGLLLLLFLSFSLVLSSSFAVPTTRSLKSSTEERASAVKDLLVQDTMELSDGDEIFDMEERYIEGRMDLESTDYPGTGANNHHDPRTPGKG